MVSSGRAAIELLVHELGYFPILFKNTFDIETITHYNYKRVINCSSVAKRAADAEFENRQGVQQVRY